MPGPGVVWIDASPEIESWSERFAGSDEAGDGLDRVPLWTDVAGDVAARLYPGPEPFLAELNAGAPALGYDSLTAQDLALGGLRFGDLHAQVRRAWVGVEVGLLRGISLEARAPLVFTEVEAGFAWDTASATAAPAASALPDAASFLDEFAAARSALEALVAGGGLTPEEEQSASALLGQAEAFRAALTERLEAERLLPLGGSAAGQQMVAHVAALAGGFAAFDIGFPELGLAASASTADVRGLFGRPELDAMAPGTSERAWNLGELILGTRVRVLDRWGSAAEGPPVGLRTAVGARVRLGLLPADRRPFHDARDFFGLPIGDGQTDIEVAAQQDLRLGRVLLLELEGRYGVQRPDRLALRVHPPERPFALASTLSTLERDLGDFVRLRAAPAVRFNEVLSVGLEYGLWHKGSDRYRILEGGMGVASAEPLEVATEETRHRVGLGFFYRPAGRPVGPTGSADVEEGDEAGAPGAERSGDGWRLALTLQRAWSGAGRRTPASARVGLTVRTHIEPF